MRKSRSKSSDPSEHDRSRIALGSHGEQIAANLYERNGYTVLHRNWRCREGELDLIVATDDTIVFCEVKTRTSAAFGSPAEAVTWTKRQRIRRLAGIYLSQKSDFVENVRFDVASVNGSRVEIIEGAF